MIIEEYKRLVTIQCQANGVQLLLPNTEKVPYPIGGVPVNGYFDDIHSQRVTLACACGKPVEEWSKIFVHEKCHMDQWLHNKELWNKQYANDKICDKIMDEWLTGKEYSVEDYTHAIRTMQELEIDCEKRTVKDIRYYELPMDPVEYIRNANAYLFFYSVMLLERKWYQRAPYEVPEILETLPATFLDDYTVLPNGFLELCKKYVF